MILILGVFVVASATAQDATFLAGSTHKANITMPDGNACKWNVYTVTDFAETKDANSASADQFSFKDGIDDAANVDITWVKPGKYYLIVEEFNGGLGGCSTRRAFAIQVDDNLLQMEFVSILSSDCFDGNKITLVPIKIQVDADNALPESKYNVTVNYTVLLGGVVVANYTPIFTYADVDDGKVDLSVVGIDGELAETKEYTIRINWAKDGFNTPFTINPLKKEHTRTIYQLPQTGIMVQQ